MKTSQKDFEYFIKRCEYWKKRLGLSHWRIDYEHIDLGNICYAQNQGWLASCKALIRLNIDWTNNGDISLNEKDLDETAKHEILHILYKYPEEELIVRLTRIIK